MTATFTPGQNLFWQYRELALEYADQALNTLAQQEPLSPEKIHRVRLAIKHLRALGQLTRPLDDRKPNRCTDRNLRDAARALASARDTQVLRATLDELPKATRRRYEHEALHQVRQQEFPDASAHSNLPRPAVVPEALRHARAYWQAQTLEVDDTTLIDNGLGRTYKKARKMGFEALAADTPGDWHELRKWTKYLYFQLQPLEPLLAHTDHRPVHLDSLGNRLGKLHDLHILIDNLRARERRRTYGEELAIALLVIRRRETALLDEVRKSTRYCFANKPGAFRRQLHEVWQQQSRSA